ncbi:MAG TPA: autotransporter-associated beta strand repeat-containing protein [Rariglobus sp.]|jgi:autotransporter-associated beta strand protein|nr:autotransporter-associated beta strand repeat-containing protein [Rariglobus sp.]
MNSTFSARNLVSSKVVKSAAVLLAASILAIGQSVQAVTSTWTGAAGSGNTDWATAANWGGSAPPSGNTLAFNAAGTSGTTLTNTLTNSSFQISGINFGNSASYTMSGNTFILTNDISNNSTGSQTLNMDIILSGARNFNVTAAASSLTFGGVISGAFLVNDSGLGTVTFNGANANTFTGGLSVTGGGTTILDFANMATPTDLMSSSNTLTLGTGTAGGGGTLLIKGKSTGTTSQTMGNLTAKNYGNNITLNSNGGSGTTLTVGTLSRGTTNATLNVDISSANTALASSQTAGTLGWATVKDGSGTGFAQATGTGIVRLTGQTTLTATSNASATDFVTSGSLSVTGGNFAVNTLTLDGTGGVGALNLGGSTMTVTQKGILSTGSNAYTISNGQVGATNSEVIIHAMGTGGLTISGSIGSGSSQLTKDGSDTLTLSGNNTYTGQTIINAGSVKAGSTTAFSGTSAVTLGQGTGANLDITGFNNSIGSLNGGAGSTVTLGAAALTIGGDNTSTTYAGVISGTGGSLIKVGTGSLTLNNGNSFTGGLTVKSGTVIGANGISNSFGTGNIVIGDAVVGLDAAISLSPNVTLASAISISSGAGNRTINDVGGAPTLTGAMTLAHDLIIQRTSTNSTGLSLNGAITGTGSVTINNGSALSPVNFGAGGVNTVGAITNTGAANTVNFNGVIGSSVTGLVQNSSGTMALKAANTFTGSTLVSAGTLALANVNALQNSPLDVSGAGTVSFTVAGTNTYTLGGLQGTGTLAAGANSIALNGTAISTVTIPNGTSFISSPAINVTTSGTFVFAGTLNVNFSASLGTGSYSFNLFDGNTGGTFNLVSVGGSYMAALNSGNSYTATDGSGNIYNFNNTTGVLSLTVAGIPEPSTYAAIFGALALGGAYWRRRRVAKKSV